MAEVHNVRPSFKKMQMLMGAVLVAGIISSMVLYLNLTENERSSLSTGLQFSLLPAVLACMIAVPTLIRTIIFTMSHKYHFGPEEVSEESGIISKRTRSIPVENIDNITVERSAVQIVFGVGDICIDTPGGADYELILKQIPVKEIGEIVSEMKGHMRNMREKNATPPEPNYGVEKTTKQD